MPMDFPNMDSLVRTANVHCFRQPSIGEAEDVFRYELAKYVLNIDRIEAFEILFKVGWDQWTDAQKTRSLTGTIT